MVSWLLPVAETLVGSLGHDPLPKVTRYITPGPAPADEALVRPCRSA